MDKRKRNILIVVGIVVFLLLLLTAGLIYYFVKRNQPSPSPQPPSPLPVYPLPSPIDNFFPILTVPYLKKSESLESNVGLTDITKRYMLILLGPCLFLTELDDNGQIVKPIWSAPTGCDSKLVNPTRLTVREDGNVVVVNGNNQVLFQTNTSTSNPILVVSPQGFFMVYDGDTAKILWTSKPQVISPLPLPIIPIPPPEPLPVIPIPKLLPINPRPAPLLPVPYLKAGDSLVMNVGFTDINKSFMLIILPPCLFLTQIDKNGNIIKPIWTMPQCSVAKGPSPFKLNVQIDGNVVLKNGDGTILFQTNTKTNNPILTVSPQGYFMVVDGNTNTILWKS